MMGAPQVIWIGLAGGGIALAAYLHGQPKKDKHSVWQQIFNTAVTAFLLWWGGFFG